jgi:hypothetical protein
MNLAIVSAESIQSPEARKASPNRTPDVEMYAIPGGEERLPS